MIKTEYKSESHKKTFPLKDIFLDDFNGFQNFDNAMTALGLLETEKIKFYEVIAAILHLGNIEFDTYADGCKIADTSRKSLVLAATLLHVDNLELEEVLTKKILFVGNASIMYVCTKNWPSLLLCIN